MLAAVEFKDCLFIGKVYSQFIRKDCLQTFDKFSGKVNVKPCHNAHLTIFVLVGRSAKPGHES